MNDVDEYVYFEWNAVFNTLGEPNGHINTRYNDGGAVIFLTRWSDLSPQ